MPARVRRAVLPLILAPACSHAPSPGAPVPTFNRDVAPIVYAQCSGCHRPGQIAPFSLLTYGDVRARAAEIVRAVESREMPPWLPESEAGRFSGARRLSDADIATIRDWAEHGAEEGRAESAPSPPAMTGTAWQLGTPDIVVTLPSAYTLPAGASDVFRNFVVPVPLSSTAFVRGVEFHPGVAHAVHHAVVGVDASGESRRLDAADPDPGYEGMLSDEFHSPDGHFVGWTPGRTPSLEPSGRAWRLEPGTDLVVQMHMLPGADAVALRPEIGLYLADGPPATVPFMVKLTSTDIDIAPGDSSYVVEDSYTLPVDVDLVSVYPHAHYLAREIRATATRPDGSSQSVLLIRNWDFHWQEFYRFESPVPLSRGTTLSMRITYDNSAEHQRHAGESPRRVLYGPRSSDEMADVWLQVIARAPGDLRELARDFVDRQRAARIRAAEQAVRRTSHDAAAYNVLGTRYVAAGRMREAIDAFTEALAIAPSNAEASNNLGTTLVAAGRPAEALPHLRLAAAARPRDARVPFNLGNALRDAGRPAEARRAFERAIAIDSGNAEAHNNLAVLAGASGDYRTALTHLEQALAIRETYPEAHHNIGLALAALGRTDAALVHVRRAIELRPDYAQARETLAELTR